MTHSHKKHPIGGFTTAHSEKDDKRRVNRRLRRKINKVLKEDVEKLEEENLKLTNKDISDVWDFAKDGKQRIDPGSPYYKKAMRK
jgi:hypothetical protein